MTVININQKEMQENNNENISEFVIILIQGLLVFEI